MVVLDEKFLDPKNPARFVPISLRLRANCGQELNFTLLEFKVGFAGASVDLSKNDPTILTQQLEAVPARALVNQVFTKEVRKVLDIGSIAEVVYPDWFARVLIVKKGNGINCMCVNFTALIRLARKPPAHLPKSTGQRVYYFKAISFYLLNVGVLHHRMANIVFVGYIGVSMEFFFDNLIVTSQRFFRCRTSPIGLPDRSSNLGSSI